MRNLLLIFVVSVMLASCETYNPTRVILQSHNDTMSVWMVHGTTMPDTLFEDIYPEFQKKEEEYVGYGYGYMPVYRVSYKHGNPNSKEVHREGEFAIAVIEQIQHAIAEGDYKMYCEETDQDPTLEDSFLAFLEAEKYWWK